MNMKRKETGLGLIIFIFILGLLFAVPSVLSALDVEKEITRQKERITRLLQPSARQKVTLAARACENKIASLKEIPDYQHFALESLRTQFRGLSSQEIDVLVQLVMFEVWQAEEEALREMLDEMDRMNELKKKQREYIKNIKEQRNRSRTKLRAEYEGLKAQDHTASPQKKAVLLKKSPRMASTRRLKRQYPRSPLIKFKNTKNMSLAELEKYIDEMETDYGTLGNLSEELSLKIQIQTERHQKIIQTLSNILKKISNTSDIIISNIK